MQDADVKYALNTLTAESYEKLLERIISYINPRMYLLFKPDTFRSNSTILKGTTNNTASFMLTLILQRGFRWVSNNFIY
jgi:hypothetical protein